MQTQKKVIDASRGQWVEMGQSIPVQKPPVVTVNRQPTYVPTPTVRVTTNNGGAIPGPITRTNIPRYVPRVQQPVINPVVPNHIEYTQQSATTYNGGNNAQPIYSTSIQEDNPVNTRSIPVKKENMQQGPIEPKGLIRENINNNSNSQQTSQSKAPASKEFKSSSTISYDPEYRNFNFDDCKTIHDAYNKNFHLMEIKPE